MSNTRCCLTHFDGEPIVIRFWLYLYEKFWRGEVNRVLCDVCYNSDNVSESLLQIEKDYFKPFPEIDVTFLNINSSPGRGLPESSGNELLPKINEDIVFMLESDGFVFGKGLVDKYCKMVETEYDIVAIDYPLLPPEIIKEYGYKGFMRNFSFYKNSLFKQIELNYFPHSAKDTGLSADLDCFGWISYQLVKLKPKIFNIPPNIIYSRMEPISSPENRWLHIRQFNSSNLGFHTNNLKYFENKDTDQIQRFRNEIKNWGEEAEWQFIKSVGFRLMMLDILPLEDSLKGYYEGYTKTLFEVINSLSLPLEKVQKVRYFYRGVLNL